MTEGRFETTFNLRPDGFDNRKHWSKSATFKDKAAKCSADHMRREACPFHDLQADGCFQPEHDTAAPETGTITPGRLVRRPLGRMRSGNGGASGMGCGGARLPIDTDYVGKDNAWRGPVRSNRPWTGKGGGSRVFSRFPYQAEQTFEPVKVRKEVPPFRCGEVGKQYRSEYIHMNDETAPLRACPPSRFKTGKIDFFDPHVYDTVPTLDVPSPPRVELPRKKVLPPPRAITQTFGRYPGHMADPFIDNPRTMQAKRRPHIFTWWTQTKRSMPISNKWE